MLPATYTRNHLSRPPSPWTSELKGVQAQVTGIKTGLAVHLFFKCRVSKFRRCHSLPWLGEFSGVVLSCYTLFARLFLRTNHPYNRKIRSYHCSRQLLIQGHRSGNLLIVSWRHWEKDRQVAVSNHGSGNNLLLVLLTCLKMVLSAHSPSVQECTRYGSASSRYTLLWHNSSSSSSSLSSSIP